MRCAQGVWRDASGTGQDFNVKEWFTRSFGEGLARRAEVALGSETGPGPDNAPEGGNAILSGRNVGALSGFLFKADNIAV